METLTGQKNLMTIFEFILLFFRQDDVFKLQEVFSELEYLSNHLQTNKVLNLLKV
jgi:hypothetical protein